jgi:hypothetical protein
MAKEYGLEKSKMREAAINAYTKHCKDGNYAEAAQIAKEYELYEYVLFAATSAFEKQLESGHYSEAAQTVKDYNLGKPAAIKVFETDLSHGQYAYAEKVAGDNGLTNDEKCLAAVRAYETVLTNGNCEVALEIATKYDFGKDIIDDTKKLVELRKLIRV